MNGRLAKALREEVYGAGGASRFRQWDSPVRPVVQGYRIVDRLRRVIGQTERRIWQGRVTADPRRQAYQALKRARRGRCWRTV